MKRIELPFSGCQLRNAILIPLNYLTEIGIWYLGYLLILMWIDTGDHTLGWLFWVIVFSVFRTLAGADNMPKYNAHLYYPVINFIRTLATIYYLITKIPIRVGYKYAD